MARWIFAIVLFALSRNVAAQQFPEHLLDALNARQIANGIEVTWTMSRGVECLGIDVERSINHGPFERVFAIGGVCGSLDQPESYRFNDENLDANGVYVYNLTLGTVGEASVSTSFQAVWESGLSLLPRGDQMQLRFEGFQGSYDLYIYNISGLVLHQQAGLSVSTYQFSVRNWPNGAYVILIAGAKNQHRQQFAIYR
jgi:hypothetical protein